MRNLCYGQLSELTRVAILLELFIILLIISNLTRYQNTGNFKNRLSSRLQVISVFSAKHLFAHRHYVYNLSIIRLLSSNVTSPACISEEGSIMRLLYLTCIYFNQL